MEMLMEYQLCYVICLEIWSQTSCITESCKRKLGFGLLKRETIQFFSLVIIYAERRGLKIELKLVNFPKICYPLPRVYLADYHHSPDLEFADSTTNNVKTVDVLMGADMCWQVTEGGIIREGPDIKFG